MIAEPHGAFRALADPTRRQILVHLSQREMTIGDIVDQFAMTRGAIKKHLTILEEGSLIRVERRGRQRVNRLEPQGLKSASDWLSYFSQFWDQRFDKLKNAIDGKQETKHE